MSFPRVAGRRTGGGISGPGGAATIQMPTGVAVGELLIAVVTAEGTGPNGLGTVSISSGSGWSASSAATVSSTVRGIIYTKVADGSDGLTLSVLDGLSGEQTAFCYVTLRIQEAEEISIGSAVTGTSTAPNSGSLNPSDVETADFLWLTVCHRNSTAAATGTPTSYSNIQNASSGDDCSAHSAERLLFASSTDPGAFTFAASANWAARTLAVWSYQQRGAFFGANF